MEKQHLPIPLLLTLQYNFLVALRVIHPAAYPENVYVDLAPYKMHQNVEKNRVPLQTC